MRMNPRHLSPAKPGVVAGAAFTLVEVLVSMTIVIILLLVSAQVIGTVQSTWTTSNARVSQFREARTAFDIITRNLSQATLNSYIDYDNSYLETATDAVVIASTGPPTKYVRKSDLRFLCGQATDLLVEGGGGEDASPGHAVFFQAPLGVSHDPAYVGLDRLMCARGYFVQYTSDDFFRPGILPPSLPRFRYRLMEFSPPAEKNFIYGGEGEAANAWFADAGALINTTETPTARGLTRPIADNIVALIIAPQFEIPGGEGSTTDAYQTVYNYDSMPADEEAPGLNDNQLPSLVKVVLVAIDERTADRLSQSANPESPPFQSLINYSADLDAMVEGISKTLSDQRVNFRIFSATVAIRGAKWSS